MKNLTKSGGIWKIGDNVVEHFLKNENGVKKKYDNNLGSLPIGTDNEGNEFQLSKHHVIPREFINEQIGKYATFVKSNRKKNEGHFNALKRKLQRILNHPEIQHDFDKFFGNSNKMNDRDNEAAKRLRENLTWYPENLFIGPEGQLRDKDPGADIDFDVLLGLEKFDETAFLEFNSWIDITNIKSGGLDNLSSKLVTENTATSKTKGVKTIIDVLYSLNESNRATYGPLWSKSGNDGRWSTYKSYPKKERSGLVRRNITNPVKIKGEKLKKVRKVNIQNGKLEYQDVEDEDENLTDKPDNQDEDEGYITGVDETNQYVADSKEKIEEDRHKAQEVRDEYRRLETNAKKLVDKLVDIANYIEGVHSDCNTGRIVGTSVAAGGGVLGVFGGIATVLTAGLAAPLLIGGIALSVAGSTTNITSTSIEASKSKEKLNEAEKELKYFQGMYNLFLTKIDETEKYYNSKELWRIRTFVSLLLTYFEVDTLGVAAMKGASSSAKLPAFANVLVIGLLQNRGLDDHPMGTVMLDLVLPQVMLSELGVKVTKTLTKSVANNISKSLGREVAKSSGKAVTKGALTAIGSGVFLIWDIVDLVKLTNDKGSEAAKCIREARDDLKKRIEDVNLGA